jgi:hypothetical protein
VISDNTQQDGQQQSVAFLVTSWSKRFFSWLTLFWIEIIIGIIPGTILGYLASGVSGWLFSLVIFLGFLVCVAGVCVTALAGIIMQLGRVPRNFFGLCTGYARPDSKKPPALVPWLNDKINEIAGKSSTEPLTFGHLANAGRRPPYDDDVSHVGPAIYVG